MKLNHLILVATLFLCVIKVSPGFSEKSTYFNDKPISSKTHVATVKTPETAETVCTENGCGGSGIGVGRVIQQPSAVTNVNTNKEIPQNNTFNNNSSEAKSPANSNIENKYSNQIAFTMVKKLYKNGDNLFISPFSLNVGMAMLYAGSEGETTEKIAKVFNFNSHKTTLLMQYQKILKMLRADNKDKTMIIANSAWLQQTLTINPVFKQLCQTYLNAEINKVDFKNNLENVLSKINQWIANHTDNQINHLLTKEYFDNSTRFILINTLQFNGKWQFPFDTKDTVKDDFTTTNGVKFAVNMMKHDDNYNYYKNELLQFIELPYANGDEMDVILPNKPYTVNDILTHLNNTRYNRLLNSARGYYVHLSLPKFTIYNKLKLNKLLTKMGLGILFSSHANLQGIFKQQQKLTNLQVDVILQQAKIIVNEAGTKAQVATVVGGGSGGSVPQPRSNFIANHPFIYFIRNLNSHAIVFAGVVEHPQ